MFTYPSWRRMCWHKQYYVQKPNRTKRNGKLRTIKYSPYMSNSTFHLQQNWPQNWYFITQQKRAFSLKYFKYWLFLLRVWKTSLRPRWHEVTSASESAKSVLNLLSFLLFFQLLTAQSSEVEVIHLESASTQSLCLPEAAIGNVCSWENVECLLIIILINS